MSVLAWARGLAHATVNAALALAGGQGKTAALAAGTGAASGEAAAIIATQIYGDAPDSLTEEQRQTVSALATLAARLAGGITSDSTASIALAAQAGKTTAENNRLNTFVEQKRLEELTKDKSDEEKFFYQAATCALINCSTELADGDPNKEILRRLEELGNLDQLESYRETLLVQKYDKTNFIYADNYVPMTYETVEKLFQYSKGDKFHDSLSKFNNNYSITTRAGGTLQAGFGLMEGAGAVVLSPTCGTGVGCMISGALIWSSFDNSLTGLSVLIDGKTHTTNTTKALSKILNINEDDAELLHSTVTGIAALKAG